MKSSRLSLFLAAATLVAASSAHAATITKAGSGTNLADSAGWTGGVLPGAADQATFDNTSLTGPLTVDTVPPTAWQQMLFGSTTPASDIGADITLSGSKITLLNSGDNSAGTYTLKSASAKAVTINNAIDFTGTARNTIRVDGTGILTLGGTINFSGAGNTVLRGTAGSTGVISGVIASAAGQVQVTDATNWTFSGLNTYTTKTTINGSLTINSIKNVGGGASSLGAVTTVANGTIDMGSGSIGSTLKYVGTGDTTDRVINLVGTTGGATLDQSGTGLLKFTSALTPTGAGAKTLTLTGSTAGTGEIAGAIVDNSGTNTTSVTKSGTGTWTLSGANTYTGATSVTAGTLINSGNSTTASVAVSSGATYNQTGGTTTATGALSVIGAAGFNAGTAGNNAAFNLSGGTASFATAALNGTTTVSGGTLNISGQFNVGDGAANRNGVINQTGGTVNLTTATANGIRLGHWNSGALLNAYNLSGGTLNALNTAFAAGYDGNGTMAVSGTGVANLRTLALSADGNANNGAANFTFTLGNASAGNNGGTLNVGTGGITLSTAPGVISTIQLGNGTVGAFANWTSSAKMTLTDATTGTTFKTLDSVDNTTARTIGLTGILSGSGKLVKTGAGSLTLSGVNGYTGGTAINGGSIITGNTSALGTGAVTLGGGTLQVGATGLTGIASLTVNSGVLNTTAGNITLSPAGVAFSLTGGTWTVGSALNGVTLTSGSFALTGGTIDLGLLSLFDKQNSGFSLISGTGSAAGLSFINGDSGFSYALDTNGDLLVTAVPEPSTYGLIGAGALAAVAMVRRRRKMVVRAA